MRYFFGFLLTIGLLILLIFLIFRGGNDSKVPSTAKSLTSYVDTGSEVSMTIDGPINAATEHRQIKVIVDSDNVTFQEIKGYEGVATNVKLFSNTRAAYNNFLYSLARAGFTQGNTDKALRNETGICPLGNRYIFKLTQEGSDIERFWATSCGGTKTYLGNLDLTIELFQNQVPEYGNLAPSI